MKKKEGETNFNLAQYKGDTLAIEIVNSFLNRIGGREKWADLKASYIFGSQRDSGFGEYQIEEWIDFSDSVLILNQIIQGEPNIRLVERNEGWIVDAGALSNMDTKSLTFLKYWTSQNFLRRMVLLAKGEGLYLRYNTDGNLYVLSTDGEKFYFGLQFNNEGWPVMFKRNAFNTQNIDLSLDSWQEFQGLTIPTIWTALDNSFFLEIEEFVPCSKSSTECFSIDFDEKDLQKYLK
ncbi:MAG: hypothetical protein RIC35_25435 [Marinoscillum sp.]